MSSDRTHGPLGHLDMLHRKLGEWVVREPVGQGGFADVYRARQPKLDRDAVIKVLRSPGDLTSARLFEREAQLASQLDHPYAAHVYSYGVESDGVMWIAMELVRGASLQEHIDGHGAMELARFVPFFERLCEVVHSAHEVGLVHRDIKPSNVMLVKRAGRLLPKLLDFGIAISSRERPSGAALDAGWGDDDLDTAGGATATALATATVREERSAIGTPAYMAPEQWHAGEPVDHRADIYALGILAHHCLTGELPFRGESRRDYLIAHTREPAPELGDEFPPALSGALTRALQKNPDERFASALELAAAVRASLAIEPTLARDEVSPWLLLAPPPIALSLSRFDAARGAAARDALVVLLEAVAQWLGVLALATARGAEVDLADFHQRRMGARDWLAVARTLAAGDRPDDPEVKIPELVEWLNEGAGPESLLALLELGHSRERVTAAIVELCGSLLGSLRFLCEYPLLVGADAGVDDPTAAWLGDGDANPLVDLAPLVVSRPPAPGEAAEIFVAAGGRSGGRLVAYPRGFELESPAIWPWLRERFGAEVDVEPEVELDVAPYVGLAPYSTEQADLFFGRERELEGLYNRLMARRCVALTGPSGSGKSSLIHAGLIPRLEGWTCVTVRPGPRPLDSLRRALASLPPAVGDLDADVAAICAWLESDGPPLLVAVDQAEELVTLGSADAERFCRLLGELAASPKARVAVTLRDDFIARANDIAAWRVNFAHSLVLIGAPNRAELAQIVEAPARRVGYRFDDPDLVDRMVDEVVDRDGALPLLSFAAARIWEARDRDRRLLTRASYEAMGGVGGALAGYAEEVLSALPRHRQTVARELFRHLVTAEGTSAPVPRGDLAACGEHADEVIEHLIEARLLVAAEGGDGVERIALIHEALLSKWPRLVRWRAEDEAGLQLRDELRGAVAAWKGHEREESYLWRGAALAAIERWLESWSAGLSPDEARFIEASNRLVRRRRRRRRRLAAAGFAILAAAVVALLVLNRRASDSRARAEEGVTDLLVRRGYAELVADRKLAALVYLNAALQRGYDSDGLRVALALAGRGEAARLGSVDTRAVDVKTWIADDDRETFLTYDDGGVVERWRWRDGGLERTAVVEHPGLSEVTTAADGYFATYGGKTLKLWSPTGEPVGERAIEAYTRPFKFVADSHDRMISGYGDTLATWAPGQEPALFGDVDFSGVEVGQLAISVDDTRALTVSAFNRGVVILWDLENRRALGRVELGMKLTAAAFLEHNRVLVAGAGAMFIVDPVASRIVAELRADDLWGPMAIYPDRDKLAAWSNGGRIRILSARDLSVIGEITRPEASSVSVAIDKDGKRLALMVGSRLEVWDAETLAPEAVYDGGHLIQSWAVSPDGDRVALGASGQLEIWDITGRDAAVTIPPREGDKTWHAAFSPDATRVAIRYQQDVRIVDVASGEEVRELPIGFNFPARGIPRAVYSADGGELMVGSGYSARIFDLATGIPVTELGGDPLTIDFGFGDGDLLVTSSQSHPDLEHGFYMTVWRRSDESVVAERPSDSAPIAVELVGDERVFYATAHTCGVWAFSPLARSWSVEGTDLYDVAVSADGRYGVCNGSTTAIVVHDIRTGRAYRTLRAPTAHTSAVALSSDGSLLATGAADGRIYLWDLEIGAALGFLRGHTSRLRALEISGDDRLLASVDERGEVRIWRIARDIRTADELQRQVDRLPIRLEGTAIVPVEAPAVDPGATVAQ